jgi:hypothetical protein
MACGLWNMEHGRWKMENGIRDEGDMRYET